MLSQSLVHYLNSSPQLVGDCMYAGSGVSPHGSILCLS